jgi:type III restriction enzyme
MALHPNFPKSPYAILDPDIRWFPADESQRDQVYEKLVPPLVAQIRQRVAAWREGGYAGASATSVALLKWWFLAEHSIETAYTEARGFRYYFAQREAVETVVWLYEVAGAHDKFELLRFDSSGRLTTGMFAEEWTRYVIKMATGSGKTKVLSLLIAWSYFHRLYEQDSKLSRNFLVIAPNIIVLDRLRADFDGLKIFYADPVLPENGYADRDWRSDFQVSLHIQDEVGTIRPTGNIFLTNIHRVYDGKDSSPTVDDEDTTEYFLGLRPVSKTNESMVDLGDIVRGIDELMVLNDEAHHVHDDRLAWFKSIQDIHNRLTQKGTRLALQIDVTATPKGENGGIFVQTVSDYPLVEAIHQDVVKHPVLPDEASRAVLQERQSVKYEERYKDYLHLGYVEWEKAYKEHLKMGKKAILFVMTDDTKNCDDVARYLEATYPELAGAVLTIHTKNNGEISDTVSGKGAEELKILRQAANDVDKLESPHKAIVSVLMLKEGWDVRNVTTIVGLRAYAAKSNILPEQTLGRGLRRMYRNADVSEKVSVIGTDAFMDFIEGITREGVELEQAGMGRDTAPKAPLIIEIDRANAKKDLAKMEISVPILTPRIYREYKNLSDLDPTRFGNKKFAVKNFTEDELRNITFRDVASGEFSHVTELDSDFMPNFQSVIGYFANHIMREMRLVSGFEMLYPKVKEFIGKHLFDQEIDVESLQVLRNLADLEVRQTIVESFRKAINNLTVRDQGDAEISGYIKVNKSRPFPAKEQGYLVPKRSPFNRIVGDSHFELLFAAFLDRCEDVVSFAKNYFAVNFKIDYKNASGEISNYYPDFLVKVSEREVWIVETKGREDLDDVEKWKRLVQWCVDVNKTQKEVKYRPLFVRQEAWERQMREPESFEEATRLFETGQGESLSSQE